MKIHVPFVAVAEIGGGVFGPLVGLAQKHPVLVLPVDMGPEFLEECVGLREVFTVGALAFVEIGNGVEAQPVDPHFEPEIEHPENGLVHLGVVVIEVRLV